jgi:hypothetical protein
LFSSPNGAIHKNYYGRSHYYTIVAASPTS